MVPNEIVSELTKLIWDTVLGLGVEDVGPGDTGGDYVTSVDISGAWEGTVSISFPAHLARRVAQAMLARTEEDVTMTEVRDVVGELANMVGGNLKSFFPGPSRLSLPRVEEAAASPSPERHLSQSFESAGHRFSVTISEGPRRAATEAAE